MMEDNEFHRLPDVCWERDPSSGLCLQDSDAILRSVSADGVHLWLNGLILAGMFVVYRVFFYIALSSPFSGQARALEVEQEASRLAAESARPPVPQARVWRLLQGEVLRSIVALHLRVFGGGKGGDKEEEEAAEGFLTAYNAGTLLLKREHGNSSRGRERHQDGTKVMLMGGESDVSFSLCVQWWVRVWMVAWMRRQRQGTS